MNLVLFEAFICALAELPAFLLIALFVVASIVMLWVSVNAMRNWNEFLIAGDLQYLLIAILLLLVGLTAAFIAVCVLFVPLMPCPG